MCGVSENCIVESWIESSLLLLLLFSFFLEKAERVNAKLRFQENFGKSSARYEFQRDYV